MSRNKSARSAETPARRNQPPRMNDTRAILSQQLEAGASHSISTRKIDNGFLIETSFCDPSTGEYRCSTRYSASAPRIIPGRAARSGAVGEPGSGDPLSQAVDYMGNRGLGEKMSEK